VIVLFGIKLYLFETNELEQPIQIEIQNLSTSKLQESILTMFQLFLICTVENFAFLY